MSGRETNRSARVTEAERSASAEQEGGGQRAASGRGDRDLGRADLALAALTPELHARLVQEAEAVQPTGRELAAVGVERQRGMASRRATLGQPRAPFAVAAEAEGL